MTNSRYRYVIFPTLPFGHSPDPVEDGQWEQIYFLFGQALLWAQAHEDGLAQLVGKAEHRWQRSGKSVDQINRMTLGALQKEYVRYCHLEDHHREDMKQVLDIRNSLAHNFYRRRMDQLATDAGREAVIAELQRAGDALQMARDDVYWNLSLLTGESPL